MAKRKNQARKQRKHWRSMLNDIEQIVVELEKSQPEDEESRKFVNSLLSQWRRFGRWTPAQCYWAADIAKRLRRQQRARERGVKHARQQHTIDEAVKPSKSHFIYAIRAGESVKLGMSTKPEARCKDLQTGHPSRAELAWMEEVGTSRQAARKAEKRLHRRFEQYHIRGEWFEAKPVLDVLLQEQRDYDELQAVYDAKQAIG